MKLGAFSDVVSLEVGSQMWIILILAYNPWIRVIIHRLWYNLQIMKLGTFSDVVSLEVGSQMWIILVLAYNAWIMAIICRLWPYSMHYTIICGF